MRDPAGVWSRFGHDGVTIMPSEGARQRLLGLIDLAWRSIPRLAPGTGEFHDWNTYARGAVARCAYLSESVLALGDRPLDGEVIARSLFDHVITFAWVAATPSERLPTLVADDVRHRLVFAEENAKALGGAMLPDEVKDEFEALRQRLPTAQLMARAADEHWAGVVSDLFRGGSSLSALYSRGFRGHSASVHPTALGIGPFLSSNAAGAVVVARPVVHPRRCSFGECTTAMTLLLVISGQALGWPNRASVTTIWREHPAKHDW